jgi:hypothetical protein
MKSRTPLFTLAVVLVCCDDPRAAPSRLLDQGFEERCGDLPCGWDQIGGPAGAARWTTTWHPGEHAIALDGDGITVRGPGGEADDSTLTFGSLEARIAARCDTGASLILRVAVVDTSTTVAPRADTLEGRFSPGGDYTTPVTTTLTASTALADGGFTGPPFGGTVPIRITGMTITKQGPGTCEVAHVVVDDIGALDFVDGC